MGSQGPRHYERSAPLRILCVCLGNICRSPAAHALFEWLRDRTGASENIVVDSAGTSASHAGEPPDARMRAAGARRGLKFSSVARQVTAMDYERFDHILAMDGKNLAWLRDHCPPKSAAALGLILDWHPDERLRGTDVPDPYYSGPEAFEQVLDLLEPACHSFLRQVHQAGAGPSTPR